MQNKTLSEIPQITNIGEERFITKIKNGTTIGYKFFDLNQKGSISIRIRGNGNRLMKIGTEIENNYIAKLEVNPNKISKLLHLIILWHQGKCIVFPICWRR
ncbi:hypothetical protein [Clostridium akagii]|uniref:hypothetical protein n=1 Tax=Clostridium akagii TaxID=91623 RepID=UPI00047A9D33|nr:hypothetical protein [Clostridium akagii]